MPYGCPQCDYIQKKWGGVKGHPDGAYLPAQPLVVGHPYQLDDLLRTRVKPERIVPSLVRQYISEVEIPKEMAQRYGIPPRPASPRYEEGVGGGGNTPATPGGGALSQ